MADWSDFEDRVASLFKMFGYEVTQDTEIRGGQTDIVARSKRWTRSNAIVECKHSSKNKKVGIDVVENFTARVKVLRMNGSIEIGYLVTNVGFTAPARGSLEDSPEKNYVFLVSYDELLHSLVDFDTYLTEYVRQFEQSKQDECFYPLESLDTSSLNHTDFSLVSPKRIARTGPDDDSVPETVLLPLTDRELLEVRERRWLLDGATGLVALDTSRLIKAQRRGKSRVLARSLIERIESYEGEGEAHAGTAGTSREYVPVCQGAVEAHVQHFMGSTVSRVCVLLGDYGAGKSTVLKHLMYSFARVKLESPHDPGIRIPLFLSLREYNKVPDFEKLVLSFLHQKAGMADVTLPLFNYLNDEGHFVLLLDGFDEMAQCVTASHRRRTFLEMAEFVGSKSKVILSGRPGYFPDHDEMKTSLGATISPETRSTQGDPLLQLECLQLLRPEHVEDFMGTISKGMPALAAETTSGLRRILADERLRDLARRPVLAGMILQSAGELLHHRGDAYDARDIYKVYTDLWIQREEDKGLVLLDPCAKADFLRLVATQMHIARKLEIHYVELDATVQRHFSLDTRESIDHFSHEVRTCSFLVRDDSGYYRFIHKSFLEYFVALEYENLENSLFRDQFAVPLAGETIDFLKVDALPPHIAFSVGIIALLDEVKGAAVVAQEFEIAAHARDVAWKIRNSRKQCDGVFHPLLDANAYFMTPDEFLEGAWFQKLSGAVEPSGTGMGALVHGLSEHVLGELVGVGAVSLVEKLFPRLDDSG